MKDAFWFQHDSNARNDVRILELRAELGWEGYGLWWALVEQLRESADYRLSNDKKGGLAMGMGIPKKQLEGLLALCFDLGLIELEDGYFFAPALCRRMEAWDTKRAALAEAGKRGAARRWAGDKPADAEPEPPQSPGYSHPIGHPNAGSMAIREEKSTEEKSTEETSSLRSEGAAIAAAPAEEKKEAGEVSEPPPANPADDSHTEGGAADVGTSNLVASRGGKFHKPDKAQLVAYLQSLESPPPDAAALAERFLNHYASNGWKIGKNAMKDWQATARNWAAEKRPTTSNTPTRHGSPSTQHPTGRYNTTARGGFGGFANSPGGRVDTQPVGGGGPGNPIGGTANPTGGPTG